MREFGQRERWEFVARAFLSAVVLTASLWVILSGQYPDATSKWAFGALGLVIGYWLR